MAYWPPSLLCIICSSIYINVLISQDSKSTQVLKAHCLFTAPSTALQGQLQACMYMVNDCEGRGEADMEMQALNPRTPALYQED